jgi:outer membrane biosynthesis protein TonB
MAGPWYCLVIGKGSPKRAHATIEIAETEAARLHALNAGQFAVRVLETVSELPATAVVQTAESALPSEPAPKPDPERPPVPKGPIKPQEKPQAVQVPAVKVKPKAGAKPAVQTQKAVPVVVVKKKRLPAVGGEA